MAVHGHSETTANVLFAVAKIKGYLGKTQRWWDVATLSHVLFNGSSELIQSLLFLLAWCFALRRLYFPLSGQRKVSKGKANRVLFCSKLTINFKRTVSGWPSMAILKLPQTSCLLLLKLKVILGKLNGGRM